MPIQAPYCKPPRVILGSFERSFHELSQVISNPLNSLEHWKYYFQVLIMGPKSALWLKTPKQCVVWDRMRYELVLFIHFTIFVFVFIPGTA